MADFFTELGKQVAAELGRPSGRYPNNPCVRQELASIMGHRLNAHLTRPPPDANDAAFDNSLGQRQMPRGPRYGDQDPDDLFDEQFLHEGKPLGELDYRVYMAISNALVRATRELGLDKRPKSNGHDMAAVLAELEELDPR